MAGIKNSTFCGKNADYTQADGPNATSSENNGLITNGQLWIGSTAVNAGSTHINVGTLTSPNNSILVSYTTPNITLTTNGSMIGQTITGDTGGALSPTAGNWNEIGQDGIKTSGSVSTLTITPRGAGTQNMFLGQSAGNATLSGINNVSYGAISSPALTSGTNNTSIGVSAGNKINSGGANVFVGTFAGNSLTTSSNNVGVGYGALSTASTTGDNTAVGVNALAQYTGTASVAIGAAAVAAPCSANNITAVGWNALANVTGVSNTALGQNALGQLTSGQANTSLGGSTGTGLLTGGFNIFVGFNAGLNYNGAETSNILLSNNGTVGESNKMRLGHQGTGNGDVNSTFIAGIVGVTVSNPVPVFINSSTGEMGVGPTSTFTWTDVSGATQTLAAQNGYITDRGAGVTYTLPASGALGDTIKIVGKLGIAVITPNANQQILIGSVSGTVGVTGTATANNVGDCIELICITSGASTVWRADHTIGTWTLA